MAENLSFNPEDRREPTEEMKYAEHKKEWLEEGRVLNAQYMFIIYDLVEQEYYPVYVHQGENLAGKQIEYGQANQQKIKEIIDFATGKNIG
jgi:hypothetical protein